MSQDQHIVVVGAGGYLGSVLTPMLLEQGYRVTAFDRFYFGRETLQAVADHPRIRIVQGDVRSFDASVLEGADAVIQMAALSNDPACELDPQWTLAVNRDSAVRIARLAKEKGVQRFLFCSSCSVYGAGTGVLTEDSPTNPVSFYAKAKLEAEAEILRMSSESFCPVSLRKATLFGYSPRMRFDLAVNLMTLHAVTKKCIYVTGGGQQWRPFLHVRDAAAAYLQCFKTAPELISGRFFNVTATSVQIAELANLVSACTAGTEVHVVPEDADQRNYHVSGALFEDVVGFRATRSIEQGIEEISAAIRDGRLSDLDDRRYYTLRTLKNALEMPAIDGGEAARPTFLPFALPLLGKEEEEEVLDTLRSGWITTGPKTHRFEEMCKEYLGCKHAVALNSCTGALHVSVAAAGIAPGDEVITTPISWPATASVVIHQGGRPVFVDVEPDTLNIDVSKIEAAITPRTKAIIPVHMAGHPCDMDGILDIAARHHLLVIEDAAHAIGAEYHGRKVGTISQATAFSFYPIKNMTTIEGGLMATDNEEFAETVRMLGNHGISRDAWKRYSAEGALHWQLLRPGFKYNMTDVQASLGLHQLPKLDQFIRVRGEYAAMYREAFADLPLRPLAHRAGIRHAHHLFVVLLDLERLSVTRDEFILALKAENIGTGTHFISMHLQPYYRTVHHLRALDLPVAYDVSQRLVSLPLYPRMSKADVHDVIKAVRKVAKTYQGIPKIIAEATVQGARFALRQAEGEHLASKEDRALPLPVR